MGTSLARPVLGILCAVALAACGDDGDTPAADASAGASSSSDTGASMGEAVESSSSSSSTNEGETSSDDDTSSDDGGEASSSSDTGPAGSSTDDGSTGEDACFGADESLVTSAFAECPTPGFLGQIADGAGVTCAQVCCVFGYPDCLHRAAQGGFEACMPEMPMMTGACEDVFEQGWSNQCVCAR